MTPRFEEIGRVCGSGPFAVFRQITLPILAPVILTGTLAGFIKSLEAFEVEQLLGRPADIYVYSTRIYDLASWEPPNFASAMALSTFVLFVLLLIAIVYQRLSRGNDYATILGRGASYRQLQIGWTRWLISAALFLVVAISLFCPLLMLICGSFMKLFGFFHIPAPYTLNHWRDVLNDPVFLSSLWNSLLLSGGAGLGGVTVYAVVAYLIVRSRLPGRRIVDLLAWLPWSIPGILLGVSVLWLILASPMLSFLYGSMASLILIMIVAQMPIGVHMMKTSICADRGRAGALFARLRRRADAHVLFDRAAADTADAGQHLRHRIHLGAARYFDHHLPGKRQEPDAFALDDAVRLRFEFGSKRRHRYHYHRDRRCRSPDHPSLRPSSHRSALSLAY